MSAARSQKSGDRISDAIRWLVAMLASSFWLLTPGHAQTNVIAIPLADIGQVPEAGVAVNVQLTGPFPRIVGGATNISHSAQTHYTDVTGTATFTNLPWGSYLCVIPSDNVRFSFAVQTNTLGAANVAALTGYTNQPPAGWPYYTAWQVDALIAGVSGGTGGGTPLAAGTGVTLNYANGTNTVSVTTNTYDAYGTAAALPVNALAVTNGAINVNLGYGFTLAANGPFPPLVTLASTFGTSPYTNTLGSIAGKVVFQDSQGNPLSTILSNVTAQTFSGTFNGFIGSMTNLNSIYGGSYNAGSLVGMQVNAGSTLTVSNGATLAITGTGTATGITPGMTGSQPTNGNLTGYASLPTNIVASHAEVFSASNTIVGQMPSTNGFVTASVTNGLATTNFVKNAVQPANLPVSQWADGYTLIWATNYGVVGVVITNWGGSTSALVSQDLAMSNCLAASANLIKPCIVLPPGIVKLTNSLEVNFNNFKLAGAGVLHNLGWGSADITKPYTMLWQSNSNLDAVHLNAASKGIINLRDLELCGGVYPTAGLSDASFYTAPMYCVGAVTNNANPFAKVGLTIRDTNSVTGGGVDLYNVVIAGFKIGLVNGGNDERWSFLQCPACDLGIYNDAVVYHAYWLNYTNTSPLNMAAYGALIDTNGLGFNGNAGSGICNLGVPDQITIDNLTFGYRRGGSGVYLGRANGFTIRTSCGIYGPRNYAILDEGATLEVRGGNDEPDGDMGTNWIYGMNSAGGVVATDWSIGNNGLSVNNYGEPVGNLQFLYVPATTANILSLRSVKFPNNPNIIGPVWDYGGNILHRDVLPGLHTQTESDGSVTDFGEDQFLAPAYMQPSTGNSYGNNHTDGLFPGLGHALLIKNAAGPDYFAGIGVQGYIHGYNNTNVFVFPFLTGDPQPWTNYYAAKKFLFNFSGDNLSARSNLFANAGYFTNSVTASSFIGTGSSLSNLNAGQLTAGTVPLAALPAAVLTNNTPSATTLNGSLSATSISSGGNITSTGGQFTGNGGSITNVQATNLVGVVPQASIPYAAPLGIYFTSPYTNNVTYYVPPPYSGANSSSIGSYQCFCPAGFSGHITNCIISQTVNNLGVGTNISVWVYTSPSQGTLLGTLLGTATGNQMTNCACSFTISNPTNIWCVGLSNNTPSGFGPSLHASAFLQTSP